MSKPEINMIVCVAENNLIGDKNPTGNGLLWHSKEELAYYKERNYWECCYLWKKYC